MSTRLSEDWSRFVNKFNLREVHQPTHTRFQINTALHTSTSSRLDRIYTSHPETDHALYNISAYIPDIPYSIINKYVNTMEDGTSVNPHTPLNSKTNFYCSDHLPVGITFTTTSTHPRKTRIPRWVANDPLFVPVFTALWPHHHNAPALDVLSEFKATILTAAKEIRKHRRVLRHRRQHNSNKLGPAISLLRKLSHRKIDYVAVNYVTHCHPKLSRFVIVDKDGLFDTSKLKRYIEWLLTSNNAPNAPSPPERTPNTPLPIATNRRKDNRRGLAEKLKETLPSTRSKLQGLRPKPSGDNPLPDPVTDHGRMARIAAEFWSKIWARGEQNEASMDAYVARLVPHQALDVAKPTVDAMVDTVVASKNTAAGVDGIPFAVYRVLAKYAAPVLHDVLTAFMSSQKASSTTRCSSCCQKKTPCSLNTHVPSRWATLTPG